MLPGDIAPLRRRYEPRLLIVAPGTLPLAAADKVRSAKSVTTVEVVDAARALVAGKRVNLLGVTPSTFRSYTPEPSAESDPLWRNIAAGDIAVSFPWDRTPAYGSAAWSPSEGACNSARFVSAPTRPSRSAEQEAEPEHGATALLIRLVERCRGAACSTLGSFAGPLAVWGVSGGCWVVYPLVACGLVA